ncbi:hypothetical protein XmelCFBP4644_19760 [Xanthomonas melonis]|uniref:Uncharacterized protein n=1 Tax=Xanthomonas melonis TaxID=56456 RepID=A0A2S7DA05_9XANT|nr:hypothetical protein XmelCFBP4644_19760 [Xanthomonas melonis]
MDPAEGRPCIPATPLGRAAAQPRDTVCCARCGSTRCTPWGRNRPRPCWRTGRPCWRCPPPAERGASPAGNGTCPGIRPDGDAGLAPRCRAPDRLTGTAWLHKLADRAFLASACPSWNPLTPRSTWA